MPSDPLAQLKRHAAAERRARERTRLSLAAALEAGYSYADVARAAGISRQAVRQACKRAGI